MRNIVVTGGAGFIGSHTCLLLLEKEYNVFVVDSFINSSPESINKILKINHSLKKKVNNKLKVFKGDLQDISFIKNVFSDITRSHKKIDGVIHFAGLKSVADSLIYPMEYWKVNVLGSINLLEVMSNYSCFTMVFSSSATVYENNGKSLLSEKSLLKPIHPYAFTKSTVETILRDIFNSSKRRSRIASLRYFNPIGAHTTGLIGENPKGKPNNIFPLIMNTAQGIQRELEIFGNDWPTPDGTPIRDFIHVMDLAEAHIKVLENLFQNEPRYLQLNVGTGLGTSVLDLIKTFEKVNNLKVPYVFAKRRLGDTGYLVADNSLLKSELKIHPKRNLEDMCRDGWKWKSLNPNGF